MDQRMTAAVAISCGAHAILALLMGDTTSPDESITLHAVSTPIHVRLVLAEAFLADREVSSTPERVGTLQNMAAIQMGGEADSPTASATSVSNLPHDTSDSRASALAVPLLQVEIDDQDTSTFPPAEATVVSQAELDVQPVPIDPVIPIYPSEASSASAGGLIKLQLLIDEVGRVTSVDVLESALPEAFGVSATRAFEAVRFRPGLRDGLPVRCRITTSIQFAPTALAQMTTAQPDAQVGQRE